MDIDVNTVTAAITAAGVAVAIWIAYQQNERARFTQEIEIMSQLDRRFDSDEFRRIRARAATWLIGRQRAGDPDGESAARDVVDFFENVGYLYRRRVLSAESVWHYFGSWVLPYYEACRDFVKQEQEGDPTCFTEFVELRDAVLKIERRKRTSKGTQYLLSASNVQRVLGHEIDFAQRGLRESLPPAS